jgi:hypothetical protein
MHHALHQRATLFAVDEHEEIEHHDGRDQQCSRTVTVIRREHHHIVADSQGCGHTTAHT